MKILVLGATGYLGLHICEYLQNKGYKVTAFIRNPKKASFLDTIAIPYVIGDINDQVSLEKAMELKFDAVINSVGYVNDRGPWTTFRKINAESCITIGSAMKAAHIDRLIHISSAAAYGTNVTNANEEMQVTKNGWNKYGVTKYEGEENLRKFAELNFTVLRPCHVLGRRDRTGIVPVMYHTTRKFSRWINNGKARIPVVYVDDVCQAIQLTLEKPEETKGQVYNVVTEEQVTVKDILSQIKQKLPIELPKKNTSHRRAYTLGWLNELFVKFLPIKLTMTRATANMAGRDSSFSNQKISKLGWKPTKNAKEMIDEWIEWRLEYESNKKSN